MLPSSNIPSLNPRHELSHTVQHSTSARVQHDRQHQHHHSRLCGQQQYTMPHHETPTGAAPIDLRLLLRRQEATRSLQNENTHRAIPTASRLGVPAPSWAATLAFLHHSSGVRAEDVAAIYKVKFTGGSLACCRRREISAWQRRRHRCVG